MTKFFDWLKVHVADLSSTNFRIWWSIAFAGFLIITFTLLQAVLSLVTALKGSPERIIPLDVVKTLGVGVLILGGYDIGQFVAKRVTYKPQEVPAGEPAPPDREDQVAMAGAKRTLEGRG